MSTPDSPRPDSPASPSPGEPTRTVSESQVVDLARWLLITIFVVIGYFVVRYAASVLGPVLVAFGIAYLLNPLLEKMVARGMSRTLAALMLLLFFVGLSVATLIIVAPRMASELVTFAESLPKLTANLSTWVQNNLGAELPTDWKSYLSSPEFAHKINDIAGPLRDVAGAALGGVVGIVGTIAEGLLIPVFSYYFLVDFRTIMQGALRIVPPRRRGKVREVAGQIDHVVAGWVRGQAIVMLILAVCYATGFTIVRLPLAIPLGILVGLLTLIPFVGAIVGSAIAVTITLANGGGGTELLEVGVVIVLLHLLENGVLTPKIVGHRVGLSEPAALFAVVAGGKLLGFVGILLAVPIAATVAVLIRQAVSVYEHSEFFAHEAAPVVDVSLDVVAPTDSAAKSDKKES